MFYITVITGYVSFGLLGVGLASDSITAVTSAVVLAVLALASARSRE